MSGRLVKVVIALVLIGVIVWIKFRTRDDTSDSARLQMRANVARMEGYAEHRAYLDALCDRAHAQAFDKGYEIGGRRGGAKFDNDKYIDAFFSTMIQAANAEGKRDLVPAVQRLRDGMKGKPLPPLDE